MDSYILHDDPVVSYYDWMTEVWYSYVVLPQPDFYFEISSEGLIEFFKKCNEELVNITGINSINKIIFEENKFKVQEISIEDIYK